MRVVKSYSRAQHARVALPCVALLALAGVAPSSVQGQQHHAVRAVGSEASTAAGRSVPSEPSATATPSTASTQAAPSAEQAARSSCDWDPRWSRFTVAESIATGTMAVGILAARLALPEPTVARWQGAILIDEPMRDAFRRPSASGEEVAAEMSDWLLRATIAMPLIDAGVAWAVHGRPGVAAEMLAMSAQSFALTFLVTEVTKRLVARERPYGDQCGVGETSGSCGPGGRYKSFISGHTSTAFTGAGLVCAHHENLPLYGGGPADAAACVTAVGAATAVGMLRIAADRHYFSDVIMGAALGLLSGYALPNWLHYDIGEEDPDTDAPTGGTVTPIATPGGVGFGYQHIWY